MRPGPGKVSVADLPELLRRALSDMVSKFRRKLAQRAARSPKMASPPRLTISKTAARRIAACVLIKEGGTTTSKVMKLLDMSRTSWAAANWMELHKKEGCR